MIKGIIFSVSITFFSAYSFAKNNHFDDVLKCHSASNAPGMAVRIDHKGQHIYSGASGLANLETKQPIHTNDIFHIGSVTKTFTAAAILKLSEQDKLKLKDTIGKYIPTINPTYKELTIESILSHTSGLPNYLDDPSVTNIWHKYAPLDKVIESISTRNVIAQPKTLYQYSNTGYVILGKIIEVTSGKSYAKFLEDIFFKPLHMNNTFVMSQGINGGRVKGYIKQNSQLQPYIKAEDLTERNWSVDRSWIHASGAIASTLEDMSIWQNALSSGQVISQASYNALTTKAVLNNGESINYGLGINIYPISNMLTYNHEGSVPGFFSWHVHLPKENLIATAFSNLETRHPGPALLDMIAIQLNLSPKPISAEKFDSIAKTLVGRYQYPDSKELEVTYEKNQFYAKSADKTKQRIIPRENNAFSYECTENYYQLRNSNNKLELIPVSLYRGEQPALIKL